MLHDKVTPYKNTKEKKEQVAEMFNNIANRYDLLNNILSLGIHKGWRKKCVRILNSKSPQTILDVATGTADFALACVPLKPKKIVGIDISEGMMVFGRKKIEELGLSALIELKCDNAETTNYPDSSFDAIVVGFGVRNFQNLEKGLQNLFRILKPGGQLVILEFSYPNNLLVKSAYNFYFSYITPLVGKMFSKDVRAYSYLTESVKAFPNNEKFVNILQSVGYNSTYFEPLSLGIAAIYYGEK